MHRVSLVGCGHAPERVRPASSRERSTTRAFPSLEPRSAGRVSLAVPNSAMASGTRCGWNGICEKGAPRVIGQAAASFSTLPSLDALLLVLLVQQPPPRSQRFVQPPHVPVLRPLDRSSSPQSLVPPTAAAPSLSKHRRLAPSAAPLGKQSRRTDPQYLPSVSVTALLRVDHGPTRPPLARRRLEPRRLGADVRQGLHRQKGPLGLLPQLSDVAGRELRSSARSPGRARADLLFLLLLPLTLAGRSLQEVHALGLLCLHDYSERESRAAHPFCASTLRHSARARS